MLACQFSSTRCQCRHACFMIYQNDRMCGFSCMRAVLSLVACSSFPACALSYAWSQVQVFLLARFPFLVARPNVRACALSYHWSHVRVGRSARCLMPRGTSGFSGLHAVLSLVASQGFPACALFRNCVEPAVKVPPIMSTNKSRLRIKAPRDRAFFPRCSSITILCKCTTRN